MWLKKTSYLLIDSALLSLSFYLAFMLRLGVAMPSRYLQLFLSFLPLVLLLKISTFGFFGFYGQLWQYASLREGLRLLRGATAASLLLLGIMFLTYELRIPRTVIVIDWLLTVCFAGGYRFLIRVKKERQPRSSCGTKVENQKRVIIVGAGRAGIMLVKQMQQHPEQGYKPVAFLDDNPTKKGLMVHGVRVVGNTRAIPTIMAGYPADEIVIAIPSAAIQERRRIAFACKELDVVCKTVPDIFELVDGRVNLSQIRNIDPKELLGRKEVEISLKEIAHCYEGMTVLITGAAGSIGSELCQQVLALAPRKVIATDIYENGLYHLEERMHAWLNGSRESFATKVMDVRDERAVERLFLQDMPDIIFHAAAYKHVPMMERHPHEAIQNNFFGTRVMVEAARRHGAKRFVLVSTDKAVKPTSIMGLSKQFAEKTVKLAAHEAKTTKFMAVRFGNVLGSNGSVIPKFKRQIAESQAVTVTHPDITRYFMTIHEAVYLIIQATTLGNGGETFVLNMGEPVRIVDLAHSMIRLSGLEPEIDIPVVFTGLRPGEKLYEQLYSDDEAVGQTKHPQIFEVFGSFSEKAFTGIVSDLETVVKQQDSLMLFDYLRRGYLLPAKDTDEYLVNPYNKVLWTENNQKTGSG